MKNNKNISQCIIDYMLAEYNGIVKAFSDLHTVMLRMMNYFLIVAAVPISFVALIFRNPGIEFKIHQLPLFIVIIFFLISLVGIIFAIILINVRITQLRYARTVNLIRRFFVDIGKDSLDILPYLNLPSEDTKPRFYEKCKVLYWQLILIGLFDGGYLCLGLRNTPTFDFFKCNALIWIACIIIGIIYLIFHILIYKYIGHVREKKYIIKMKPLEKHIVNI